MKPAVCIYIHGRLCKIFIPTFLKMRRSIIILFCTILLFFAVIIPYVSSTDSCIELKSQYTSYGAVEAIPVGVAVLAFLSACGVAVTFSSSNGGTLNVGGVETSVNSLINEYSNRSELYNSLASATITSGGVSGAYINFTEAMTTAMSGFMNWLMDDKMVTSNGVTSYSPTATQSLSLNGQSVNLCSSNFGVSDTLTFLEYPNFAYSTVNFNGDNAYYSGLNTNNRGTITLNSTVYNNNSIDDNYNSFAGFVYVYNSSLNTYAWYVLYHRIKDFGIIGHSYYWCSNSHVGSGYTFGSISGNNSGITVTDVNATYTAGDNVAIPTGAGTVNIGGATTADEYWNDVLNGTNENQWYSGEDTGGDDSGGSGYGISALLGALSGLAVGLGMTIGNIADSVRDVAQDIGQTIGETLTDIWDFVTDFPQSIMDWLNDTFDLTRDFVMSGLTSKFPFCIPFDLVSFFTKLNSSAVTPIFNIPVHIPVFNINYTFNLDFSNFDSLARIVRNIEFVAFCVALLLITRNIIKN